MDLISSFKPHFPAFYSLQYPTQTPKHPDSFADSPYYNVGPLDLCIIISFIAVMAVLRDGLRLFIFEPFARWKLHRDLRRKYQRVSKANGVAKSNGSANGHVANENGVAGEKSKKANGSPVRTKPSTKEARTLERSVMRFAEQGWSVVYYTISFCFGSYIHANLPTRLLNPTALWTEYPHIPLAGPLKFYYLLQTAFYLHQILIINAEARRKDHFLMLSHHVITSALLIASYLTNFTRVGCVIVVLMDCCDIYLPLAKMIRYLNISQRLCDSIFGIWMVSWFITRHVLYPIVIYSTICYAPYVIPFAWDPPSGVYVPWNAFVGFCISLLILEVMQIIWFTMICKVAWRVMSGSGAADDRSDDEDE